MNSIKSLILLLICLESEANPTDVNIPFDHHFHSEPILPFETWGTFRGVSYFGLRSTSPNSPAVGLIWFDNNAKDVNSLHVRHWCSYGDNLRFGWKYHDFKGFGLQTIEDKYYNLNTSFIKESASQWKSLVSAIPKDKPKEVTLSLIIYVTIQRDDDSIETIALNKSEIVIKGFNRYTGNFSLGIGANDQQLLSSSVLKANNSIEKITDTIKSNLKKVNINGTEIFVFEDKQYSDKCNFIAFQMVFVNTSEVIIDFKTKSYEEFSVNDYRKELNEKIKTFGLEFEQKFGFKSKGFNESQTEFAKAVIGELLGSVGYLDGNLSVTSPGLKVPKSYGPLQILSGLPSRPHFNHPFLWDEGFHNLVIQKWSSDLTLKIMKSWFDLMNIEGWIPREVVIGKEAIAALGSNLTQTDDIANPPAFLLTIDSLLRHKRIDDKYLNIIYPRLKAWFQWFNTSQVGQKASTYRWRDRRPDPSNHVLNPDTLSSGLDDFPRATHPTDEEYHLDIRCWMALASDIMSRIADIVKDIEMKNEYENSFRLLSDNKLLDSLHWSEEHKAYCDYGLHSTNVSLVEDTKTKDMVRKVWTPPEYQLTCDQLGYNNLYPLMFGLIDSNSSNLGHVLDSISDSSQLWTPYGLRSISKTSPYYMKFNSKWETPYWRGPIWINVNYLVLKGLRHYATTDGPYKGKAEQIYGKLRNNLIDNMFRQYQRTGFLWEQYNDVSGDGQRNHPFAGWSVLIVLIMSEDY